MPAFDGVIDEAVRGGAVISVPGDVVSALGGAGRIPVQATFDGVPYRGSVVRMGGRAVIRIDEAIRAEVGKGTGDPVHVTLELDGAERTVTVPDDLRAALDGDEAAAVAFAELSNSHRRAYVEWIEEAKTPATRARRVLGTLDRLR